MNANSLETQADYRPRQFQWMELIGPVVAELQHLQSFVWTNEQMETIP